MEKLKKYNQKLLAVIGTLALAGLGLLILGGIGAIAIELFQTFNNNSIRDNALTIEAPEDSTSQVNALRDQEISLGQLQLIDTLNAIYLIPVSQVNLKNPELIEENEGLFDLSSSYESKKIKYGYRYSGVYNNLIIYEQLSSQKTPVFNERVHVSAFQHYIVKDEQYLLIEGTIIDTNKDKKLDGSDHKSFFTFKISTMELKKFSFQNMSLVDYYVTFGSNEVILRFVKDKNQNGEIEAYQEPMILKKLQLSTYEISDLIDQAMLDELQQLID